MPVTFAEIKESEEESPADQAGPSVHTNTSPTASDRLSPTKSDLSLLQSTTGPTSSRQFLSLLSPSACYRLSPSFSQHRCSLGHDRLLKEGSDERDDDNGQKEEKESVYGSRPSMQRMIMKNLLFFYKYCYTAYQPHSVKYVYEDIFLY